MLVHVFGSPSAVAHGKDDGGSAAHYITACKDKVTMDFAFFAIAFNLKKMCARITKITQNGGKGGFTPSQSLIFVILLTIMSLILDSARPAKKLVA